MSVAAVDKKSSKPSELSMQIKGLQSHREVVSFVTDFIKQMGYQEAVAALYQFCNRKKPANIAKFRKSKILYQVLRIIFDNMESLSSIELMQVLASLSSIKHQPVHFLTRLENVAIKLVPEMNSIDISMLIYSYSQFQLHPKELLQLALKRGHQIIHYFDSKSISTILQGLGALQLECEDFLVVATKRLKELLAEMEPFPFSISIQSLGKLGYYDEDLMNEMKQIVSNKLIQFSPHQLCMIVWGCVRVNYHPCELFDLVCESFTDGSKRVRNIDVATMIWAMGHFGYMQGKEQCIQMSPALVNNMQEMSPLTLTNSLWGLALMECFEIDVYQQLMDQANVMHKRQQLDPSLLRQVFQSYILSKKSGLVSIDPQLKAEGCKWWIRALHEFQPSDAFNSLKTDLKRLKVDFQSDVATDDSLHKIDFVFTNKNQQLVALQITGLYEHALNTHTMLGSPTAQNRLLEEKGYKVVTLNGWKYTQKIQNGYQLIFLEKFLRQYVELDFPEGRAEKWYRYTRKIAIEKKQKQRANMRKVARNKKAASKLIKSIQAELDESEEETQIDEEQGETTLSQREDADQSQESNLINEEESIMIGQVEKEDYEDEVEEKGVEEDIQQLRQIKKITKNSSKAPRIGLPSGLRVVRQHNEVQIEQ